jgi:hypothetical protein
MLRVEQPPQPLARQVIAHGCNGDGGQRAHVGDNARGAKDVG